MPGIVEFPTLVQDAVAQFGDLFANEPQRRHFAEYSHRPDDRRAQDRPRNQRRVRRDHRPVCLNRFLTEVEWDEQSLNERRLEWLQKDPTTRYSDQGVIAIDDMLIDHDGKFIKDVGWFWDHAEERNKIAHDYLFVNYVCTSGKHYPLEFRRFRKREIGAARRRRSATTPSLFCELVDWVCEREIPGDFTFDSYFTNAEILNHIHGKQDRFGRPRGYVGDLKFNRKIEWKGQIDQGEDVAASIPAADRKELRSGDQRQWYFTVTMRIPEVNHKVRIVILWQVSPRRAVQDPGDQPDHLGSVSDRAGVSASLDGHGDLSSGRQAAAWHG